MESMILFECRQLCDLLQHEASIGTGEQPMDMCFKTNLSVVNALWMILVLV
jgi:hypothetical protein